MQLVCRAQGRETLLLWAADARCRNGPAYQE